MAARHFLCQIKREDRPKDLTFGAGGRTSSIAQAWFGGRKEEAKKKSENKKIEKLRAGKVCEGADERVMKYERGDAGLMRKTGEEESEEESLKGVSTL